MDLAESWLKRFSPPPEEGYGWVTRVVGTEGTEYQMRNKSLPQRDEERGQYEISFRYSFDSVQDINIGEVKIHNVITPRAIEHFEKGKLMIIEAGWLPEMETSVLSLNGTVERVLSTRVGETELTLDILFSDSSEVFLTMMTNYHAPPGVDAGTAFKAIVAQMEEFATPPIPPEREEEAEEELTSIAEDSAPIVVTDDGVVFADRFFGMELFRPAATPVYERRGKTFFRPGWMALDELARDMESKYYVNNRAIVVLPKGEGIPSDVLLDDGTNGFPIVTRSSRIHEETDGFYKNEYEEFEPADVRVRTMLNPDIGPDTILEIVHEEIGGRYRVIRGEHWSAGNEFLTEFDAVLLEEPEVIAASEEDAEQIEDGAQEADNKQQQTDAQTDTPTPPDATQDETS